ncbi:hypothetical protein L7F22_003565 [Adiantum nelumboides]|nr:hypothetical protein [Adiantum nelumboides]
MESVEETVQQMDGNKEEGSSSEDRQFIPTAHEIGESSGQTEEALQVVTVVTMLKQLMENPRTCHFLSLLLDELDVHTTALHSMKSQPQRLASLNRFKSGQVPVLIATDVASRGLDIPTVDLVINYDIPRFTRDYVHRVGRTARAGRGGLSLTLVSQYDVDLVHEIELLIGKQLEEYKVDEDDVLKGITKVFKAKRLASQKMQDSGFEDLLNDRKEKKLKMLKGNKVLKKKRKRKQKGAP